MNERGASFATATVNAKGEYEYAHDASADIQRNPTRVVRFRAPHNSAVQLFDFKNKTHRVVFGPDFIMLQPYEDITVLRISGGIPKQENRIRNLAMLLGPDFMTDQLDVETSDHAKLRLVLAYSWRFNVDKSNKEEAMRLFQIKDFIGDACKAMASRIRGVVSTVKFDEFHKHSSEIIRKSVFKTNAEGQQIPFLFSENNL